MPASVNRITEISDWLSAHVRLLDHAGERCEAIVKRLRANGASAGCFTPPLDAL